MCALEVQFFQAEARERVGDWSYKAGIGREIQLYEASEIAQLTGERTAKIVVRQNHSRNHSVDFGSNSIPFSEGLIAQPVRVVGPVRSSCGMVQRYQLLPVFRGNHDLHLDVGRGVTRSGGDDGGAVAHSSDQAQGAYGGYVFITALPIDQSAKYGLSRLKTQGGDELYGLSDGIEGGRHRLDFDPLHNL